MSPLDQQPVTGAATPSQGGGASRGVFLGAPSVVGVPDVGGVSGLYGETVPDDLDVPTAPKRRTGAGLSGITVSDDLERTDKLAFCFQGHPEASPGPHDIAYLFDRFTALMEKK